MDKQAILERHMTTLNEAAEKNEERLLSKLDMTAKDLVELHKEQRDIGVAFQWMQVLMVTKFPQRIVKPMNGSHLKLSE